MADLIRNFVLTLMRVPPEPQTPEGSPESIRVFRAGRNFIGWQMVVWFFLHFTMLLSTGILMIGVERALLRAQPWVRDIVHGIEFGLAFALVFSWIITYYQILLNYELRWYIVTDRSLRIRSGIFDVQELTLTFANIQEIRISASPLQVLLGIADVQVHTAGGSTPGTHGGHVARFQGVDNANAIRDLIVERLRVYRDSGLGEATQTATRLDAATAAQEVLTEARALRQFLASGS